jgi:hypothetical protein
MTIDVVQYIIKHGHLFLGKYLAQRNLMLYLIVEESREKSLRVLVAKFQDFFHSHKMKDKRTLVESHITTSPLHLP